MSMLDAEQIADVVFALVGDTDAHGDSYLDKAVRRNQKVLTDVIDTLIYDVYKKTKYANRVEYSMKVIGEDAIEFLGYLVEEYGLNDYVRKDDETN